MNEHLRHLTVDDLADLLKRYVWHVGAHEGVAFLRSGDETEDFSEADIALVDAIADGRAERLGSMLLVDIGGAEGGER